MTPAQHIELAEHLADEAFKLDNEWSEAERISMCLLALTHATIAAAVELGAPHAAGDPAGGTGAQ